MATNTYVALDKITVGTATPSITFSSIPATYTDLVLVVSAATTSIADQDMQVGNGSVDTGSNYSRTWLQGNGSAASSGRGSNETSTRINTPNGGYLETTLGSSIQTITFLNYANTTTYKTMLTRTGGAAGGTSAIVHLWRSTSAINTIKLTPSSNFIAGSTFSLYGIRAEGVSPAAKATGGAIYSDSTYYYHVFAASGTFTPTQSLSCDIVTVAGGGSGAYNVGGGGGAGGVFVPTTQSLTATGYTVTVGAGGAAKTSAGLGNNGSNSSFGALTVASGGGAGNDTAGNGAAGGSGGGARQTYGTAGASNQSSTGGTGYGFAGAVGALTNSSGGGGGAGGAGTGGVTGTAGSGGVGITSISWSGGTLQNALSATGVGQLVSGTYYLAGGGGGGTALAATVGGPGGLGGGGVGAQATTAGSGIANTGGGGGGNYNANSGSGGSGVVIIRYAK